MIKWFMGIFVGSLLAAAFVGIFGHWLSSILISKDIEDQIIAIPQLELAKEKCDKRGMGFALQMGDYTLFCYDRTTQQVYYFNLLRE